jgi:glycosyltransferase involved in cell wall biosynthesis
MTEAGLEKKLTILVKTFERPNCLARLLTSVRRFYPHVPILVVDDSAAPLDPVPAGITKYLHEPYNSLGIAGGRNFGLRHVETEFVLICDDDMVIVPKTDIRKMLWTLETTRFDIVACRLLDHDPWRGIPLGHSRFEGTVEIVGNDLVRRLGTSSGRLDGLPVYDMVAQFFVAAVDRLGSDPWNAELNLQEHVEFFLVMRERGLLSTSLSDVVVEHHPRLPAHYYDVRMQRASYNALWSARRGIERKVFVGRLFTRRDRIVIYYPALLRYGAWRALQKIGRFSRAPTQRTLRPSTRRLHLARRRITRIRRR